MSASDLAEIIEQYHRAVIAVGRGDPEPAKKLFSRRDDVTLANPFGPAVRGWDQVAQTIERAASQFRDGEAAFERTSDYATADMAYMVEVERERLKIGGGDDMVSSSLRVTTIFRREDDEWTVVHRHADPITSPRPVESLVNR